MVIADIFRRCRSLSGRGLLLCLGIATSPLLAAMPPISGPPPEAFSACAGRETGGQCRFTAPQGEVSGRCRIMAGRGVCVPDNPPGMGGSPPGNDNARPLPVGDGPSPLGADIAGRNARAKAVNSRVPDTHQGSCFDTRRVIPCPAVGKLYGQDADYLGRSPAYRDNGDGTITDRVTGLEWQQAHHDQRVDFYTAAAQCEALHLGGHGDWRLPAIKELFSLADFRGSHGRRPYLDDRFDFRLPDAAILKDDPFASSHTPAMMGQTWSATIYTGVHFGQPGVEAAFFFNFLDGHIKQAPTRGRSELFYRCVRGPRWDDNRFAVLDEHRVRDEATGLVWQKTDDGKTRNWPEALAYCEGLDLGGRQDWRLPNIKELQSIVDYSRHAPAIDERFLRMSDPRGWYWSSTTHGDNITHAAYICFGACTSVDGVDVHGAGAQRSDPKVGDPKDFGPLGGQRDEVRIYNYVRCVR